jgi:hypothetical protein
VPLEWKEKEHCSGDYATMAMIPSLPDRFSNETRGQHAHHSSLKQQVKSASINPFTLPHMNAKCMSALARTNLYNRSGEHECICNGSLLAALLDGFSQKPHIALLLQ